MMKIQARRMKRTLWCTVIACLLGSLAQAQAQDSDEAEDANIVTIDHGVAHVSTVPANAGQRIELFVRERARRDAQDGKPRKAVLMLHGAASPALVAFQLEQKHYDWSLELAKAGFDVFMLDFQGSGRSPRPAMDDPCNAPLAQQDLLIPNPLTQKCSPPSERLPTFPFVLVNAQSDSDELNTVIDYIRAARGVEKVALVGWSHAAVRMGPYAAQHPEKVDSLLFLAPIFGPPSGIPATRQVRNTFLPPYKKHFAPDGKVTVIACTAAELGPQGSCAADVAPSELLIAGTPMTLRTRRSQTDPWRAEIACKNQVEEGMEDAVWKANMDNDDVGSTWGPPLGAPEGLMRVRTFALWGWNSEMAEKISAPVLVIGGELDKLAPPSSLAQLYGAIRGKQKLLFNVACTGHNMVWERQARVLHHVSKQWLKHGEVEGFSNGSFLVDTEGNMLPQ